MNKEMDLRAGGAGRGFAEGTWASWATSAAPVWPMPGHTDGHHVEDDSSPGCVGSGPGPGVGMLSDGRGFSAMVGGRGA